MAITQLSAVKSLLYILSNVMALFTVLPLAIAIICLVNIFMGLLDNRMLIGIGMISYEIYLVHAFTLGIVKESVLRILVFIVSTYLFSFALHTINGRLKTRK